MAFHDIRLPVEVERGVRGGPRFKTTIRPLKSGFEKRNQEWERVRGEWDVGYGMLSKDDEDADHTFTQVQAFFYARRGRAHTFRFKDWSDFTIGLIFIGGQPAQDDPQTIATGDGVEDTFQIFKRYEPGTYQFDRPIYKPIASTVRPFLDGVEQTVGFTVDDDVGTITFTPAPPMSTVIAVICEFDVAVRFDTDAFDVTLATFQAGQIPNLPIVECRVTNSSGDA